MSFYQTPHLRKNARFSFTSVHPLARARVVGGGDGRAHGAHEPQRGSLSLSLARSRALSLSRAPRAAHSSHKSPHKPFLHSGDALPALAHSGFGTDTLSLSPRCVRAPPVSLQAGRVRELRAAHPLRGGSCGQRGVQRGTSCPQFGVGLCARVVQRGDRIEEGESIRSLSSLRDAAREQRAPSRRE